MKKLLLIAFCLLPLIAGGQDLIGLRPMRVVSIAPVPKDTASCSELDFLSAGSDTLIDFYACSGEEGVVGYLMKTADFFQRSFFQAKVKGTLLDGAWLNEVQRAEEVLAEVLNRRADSAQMIPECLTASHYNLFTRQYIIYLNKVGDTCAYINCLKGKYHHPERRFIMVNDGGDNYWQAKLNLTRRQLMDIRSNGPVVTYVESLSRKPQVLDKGIFFTQQNDAYFDCYYEDLPRIVRNHLPKEYPIDMLTKYKSFKYEGHDYYIVSYSNGYEVGFNSSGQWMSLLRWQGITQEEVQRMTGRTKVYDAVVREMAARGYRFPQYGHIRWVERVKNNYVLNIRYTPSNDPASPGNANDMDATLIIDRKGCLVDFIINRYV